MSSNTVFRDSSFLFGANAPYIAELFERYSANKQNVTGEWRDFFDSLHDDDVQALKDLQGPAWGKIKSRVIGVADDNAVAAKKSAAPADNKIVPFDAAKALQAARDTLRAYRLIRSYRVRGHMLSKLDPLDMREFAPHPELDPATHGFTAADMDRPIFIDGLFGLENATPNQILSILRATYCGTIGYEFMHIQDPLERGWFEDRVENKNVHSTFNADNKKEILTHLTEAEGFEQFLAKKFVGTKRFGIEGGEATLCALEEILSVGSALGVEEFTLGMAHRGRLNVLSNFLKKPFTAIFAEFQGVPANPEDVQGSGDVKYHMGTSVDREVNGKLIHLSLMANPSHLEAVNPVAMGKVRAKQTRKNDTARDKVVCLLIHGDAAFAGQGMVAECLMMSRLEGYSIGGTIHVVINNQVGFTTRPEYGRSSPYCSDVAQMIKAPIIHVNGDDAEAVVFAARLAMEYRQTFKKDVVIDINCYRRQGHNESDEPAFTLPRMYKKIHAHPTTRTIYAQQLAGENILNADAAEQIRSGFFDHLETQFEASKSYRPNKADWLGGAWAGLEIASGEVRRGKTDLTLERLQALGEALTHTPDGFDLNSKIARQFEAKKKMFETGEGFDWGTAESLAFASLLSEGYPVRLSGQDVGRGTFSHRHAILYDQTNEKKYLPMNNVAPNVVPAQARAEIMDSPLSEEAVLGYDYGYSVADPFALVCWEGQFGDFVNGAQVIIDQFISSAESKWLRMSGLVMLLPHGYEGQGPEHSSCRIERFLQLCAEDNMQVANCTTPANYFHILRRQIHRNFRKPLIIATPKSLLRHKMAVSALNDFGPGSCFHRVLPETETLDTAKVKRVVLCTGKVYYDLLEARTAKAITDIALVRVEQLYPFPETAIVEQLQIYKNAEVVWCQEEPENMGYWHFMDRRIERAMTQAGNRFGRPRYVGRPEAASPATGSLKRHTQEQELLIREALTV